jgi:hypothetical protein
VVFSWYKYIPINTNTGINPTKKKEPLNLPKYTNTVKTMAVNNKENEIKLEYPNQAEKIIPAANSRNNSTNGCL